MSKAKSTKSLDALNEDYDDDNDDDYKKPPPRWVTRAMAEEFSHQLVLKTTVREAFIFLIFVFAVIIATIYRRNSFMYFLTKAIREQFIDREMNGLTYPDIRSVTDFWNYVTTVLVENFYPEHYYDSMDPVAELPKDDIKVLYENQLIGVPRLRQVKMRSDSCTVHDFFRRLFTSCYDMYSMANEDRSSFGPAKGTAWVYNGKEVTNSVIYHGQIATYSEGGYFQDLGKTRNETLEILNKLKDGLWVTRGTRVIFIDFSLYNANVNLFCICKLIFEFPPTGGIIPTWDLSSVQMLFYLSNLDYFTNICEGIVYLLGLFYIGEEMREMYYFRWRYFSQFWTYIDILIIGMTLGNVITSVIVYPNVDDQLQLLRTNDAAYGNLEYLTNIKELFNIFTAALLFFTAIKIFKYLSFNKRMGQLNNTLKRCAWDIFGFSIMFFIIFFAFAELGYLLFGSQVEDFSSFGIAMFTLLRTILGDFDYQSIEHANRFLAPIYFLSYIFFVFFVLLNMFLAIINDSYADVKTELTIAPDEMQMSEYLSQKFYKFCEKLGWRRRIGVMQMRSIASAIASITEALKKCGFNDQEIKIFFSRFKIEEQTEEIGIDTKTLIRDLDAQIEMMDDENALIHISDFLTDDSRLTEIEQGVEKLSGNIDVLLKKVDGLIEARMNPKATT